MLNLTYALSLSLVLLTTAPAPAFASCSTRTANEVVKNSFHDLIESGLVKSLRTNDPELAEYVNPPGSMNASDYNPYDYQHPGDYKIFFSFLGRKSTHTNFVQKVGSAILDSDTCVLKSKNFAGVKILKNISQLKRYMYLSGKETSISSSVGNAHPQNYSTIFVSYIENLPFYGKYKKFRLVCEYEFDGKSEVRSGGCVPVY